LNNLTQKIFSCFTSNKICTNRNKTARFGIGCATVLLTLSRQVVAETGRDGAPVRPSSGNIGGQHGVVTLGKAWQTHDKVAEQLDVTALGKAW
jgi:hypothetical protein